MSIAEKLARAEISDCEGTLSFLLSRRVSAHCLPFEVADVTQASHGVGVVACGSVTAWSFGERANFSGSFENLLMIRSLVAICCLHSRRIHPVAYRLSAVANLSRWTSSARLQRANGETLFVLSGTLTVEEVYKDRDQFAALVREVAAPDVGRMGIEILSFTIKDVYDDVQYLASLGRAQTAVVKRDAATGVANAARDSGIREAECEKSAMDVKYSMDTKIEDNSRMYKLQKAQFDQDINTAVRARAAMGLVAWQGIGELLKDLAQRAKAEAALAYELQAAKIKQKIRNEEIQIDVVERRKQIEVEQQEIMRREQELIATVRLPAEAEAYRLQTIAEGKRTQTVEGAKADAERIKALGVAEAMAIGDVGKADAERMLAKAKVYKQYGDAAMMALVLEALPKIAAEVSAPLAKTDEIVLVGDTGASGEIARLAAGVPRALQTLTGLDINQALRKFAGDTDNSVSATASKKKDIAVC
ncbi:Flotillin-2 [Eumeta japonica]|uniref:Flotillin-2 n=1 Tax=Eumeta variegata TaxID=151549 RepID=A0A4C1W0C7_EUMVA|nr:Flotillin-2 [Eumeta japonica]